MIYYNMSYYNTLLMIYDNTDNDNAMLCYIML